MDQAVNGDRGTSSHGDPIVLQIQIYYPKVSSIYNVCVLLSVLRIYLK